MATYINYEDIDTIIEILETSLKELKDNKDSEIVRIAIFGDAKTLLNMKVGEKYSKNISIKCSFCKKTIKEINGR